LLKITKTAKLKLQILSVFQRNFCVFKINGTEIKEGMVEFIRYSSTTMFHYSPLKCKKVTGKGKAILVTGRGGP
jgi:hypothetical protein